MKRDQIADRFGIARSHLGGFLTVNPSLNIERPFSGILLAPTLARINYLFLSDRG
jgi:hypothetical protein